VTSSFMISKALARSISTPPRQNSTPLKTRVMATEVNGTTVRGWERLFRSKDDAHIKRILEERLGVTEGDADELLE